MNISVKFKLLSIVTDSEKLEAAFKYVHKQFFIFCQTFEKRKISRKSLINYNVFSTILRIVKRNSVYKSGQPRVVLQSWGRFKFSSHSIELCFRMKSHQNFSAVLKNKTLLRLIHALVKHFKISVKKKYQNWIESKMPSGRLEKLFDNRTIYSYEKLLQLCLRTIQPFSQNSSTGKRKISRM